VEALLYGPQYEKGLPLWYGGNLKRRKDRKRTVIKAEMTSIKHM